MNYHIALASACLAVLIAITSGSSIGVSQNKNHHIMKELLSIVKDLKMEETENNKLIEVQRNRASQVPDVHKEKHLSLMEEKQKSHPALYQLIKSYLRAENQIRSACSGSEKCYDYGWGCTLRWTCDCGQSEADCRTATNSPQPTGFTEACIDSEGPSAEWLASHPESNDKPNCQ